MTAQAIPRGTNGVTRGRPLRPRPDYVYGNTRLRARFPLLLSRAELLALTGRSPEAILGSLPALALRDGVRASVRDEAGADIGGDGGTSGGTSDGARVGVASAGSANAGPSTGWGSATGNTEMTALRTVQALLQAQLRGLRGLYVGPAMDAVMILLARHDLADVLALVRGARAGAPTAHRLAAVLAVGAIEEDVAREVAAATDASSTVGRLVALGLPDPDTAQVLARAWATFQLHDDPLEFETTVATAAVTRWLALAHAAGRDARPVAAFVQSECDRANLLVALGSPTGQVMRLLPDHRPTAAALRGTREEVLAAAAAARPAWRPALERFAADGDRGALAAALDTVEWDLALRGRRLGNPLDASVPVSYVVAVEGQARALRWLLQTHRRPIDVPLLPSR